MANYTDLANLAVGTGGLPSGTTVTALRDNPIAIAEGAVGAPKVESEGLDMFSQSSIGGATYIDLDRVDKVLITVASSTNYNISTDNGATFGGNISLFTPGRVVSLGSSNNAIKVNAAHAIVGVSGVKP